MKHLKINWAQKMTMLLAAVCATLVIVVSHAATDTPQWLLQVDGVPISRELYSFFLTQALVDTPRDANGVPVNMLALREDVMARAEAFVAVESELANMGVSLDPVATARAVERTTALWRVFGNYFTAMGISKEVVGIGEMNLAAQDQLFRALYDTGGTRAVDEEMIESYFYGNFVAFDGMRLFFTVMEEDGTERNMTQTERGILIDTMRAMLAELNREDGPSIYDIAQDEQFAPALNDALPAISMIRRGVDLPVDQFDQVRNLSPDRFSMLEFENELIVARGVNMRVRREYVFEEENTEDENDENETDEANENENENDNEASTPSAPSPGEYIYVSRKEEFFYFYRAYSLRTMMSSRFDEDLEELFAAFRADENVAAVEALLGSWDFGWGWRG